MYENRRSFPRIVVNINAQLQPNLGFIEELPPFGCRVCNLSASGACFETAAPLFTGDTFKLTLKAPLSEDVVCLEGSVVWREPFATAEFTVYGARLYTKDNKPSEILQRDIERILKGE